MPTIEAIQQFQKSLLSLGEEEGRLRGIDVDPELVAPPSPGENLYPEDIKEEQEPPPAESSNVSIDDLVSNVTEQETGSSPNSDFGLEPEQEEAPPVDEPPGEEPEEEEGFSPDSGFGFEPGQEEAPPADEPPGGELDTEEKRGFGGESLSDLGEEPLPDIFSDETADTLFADDVDDIRFDELLPPLEEEEEEEEGESSKAPPKESRIDSPDEPPPLSEPPPVEESSPPPPPEESPSLEEVGEPDLESSLDDLGASEEFALDDISSTVLAEGAETDRGVTSAQRLFSEEEVADIRATLLSMPRNLRLAVEQAISEKNIPEKRLEKLFELLIKGVTPKKLSSQLYKLTKVKVELPVGYIKRRARDFLNYQETVQYSFLASIWPNLRLGILFFTLAWILFILVLGFVYRPLRAISLYKRGVKAIEKDLYESAEFDFETASLGWPFIPAEWIPLRDIPVMMPGYVTEGWFLQYAEAYKVRRAYYRAEEVYKKMVGEFSNSSLPLLEYGEMLSVDLGEYEKADALYEEALLRVPYDFDTLLAKGENYLRWAVIDENKYEEARQAFAIGIERHGGQVPFMAGMLKIFTHRKDSANIERLHQMFQNFSPPAKYEDSLDEMNILFSNYMIDNMDLTTANRHLGEVSLQGQMQNPEYHYQYARYHRILGSSIEEDEALRRVKLALESNRSLDSRRLELALQVAARRGELNRGFEDNQTALKEYSYGVSLYEEFSKRNLVQPDPIYGSIYAGLGDFYYFQQGFMDISLLHFNKAEEVLYSTSELKYKKGSAYYHLNDYENAALEFDTTFQSFPANHNLLYSMANTMSQKKSYQTAIRFYNSLLDQLRLIEQSRGVLLPFEQEEDRELIEFYVKAYNNLGLTYYYLFQAQGESGANLSKALAQLTRSIEYGDILTRDPETMLQRRIRINPETGVLVRIPSHGTANIRAIINPSFELEPIFYDEIPYDLNAKNFLREAP